VRLGQAAHAGVHADQIVGQRDLAPIELEGRHVDLDDRQLVAAAGDVTVAAAHRQTPRPEGRSIRIGLVGYGGVAASEDFHAEQRGCKALRWHVLICMPQAATMAKRIRGRQSKCKFD
jgi:hypothetical protein